MKMRLIFSEPGQKNVALEVEVEGVILRSLFYKNTRRNRVKLALSGEELNRQDAKNAKD